MKRKVLSQRNRNGYDGAVEKEKVGVIVLGTLAVLAITAINFLNDLGKPPKPPEPPPPQPVLDWSEPEGPELKLPEQEQESQTPSESAPVIRDL